VEPAFDIYFGAVIYAGATPKFVSLQPKETGRPIVSASDLQLDYHQLREVLSERSRQVWSILIFSYIHF